MDMDDGACDDWFSEEDNCEELDQDDCEFSEECSWNDYDMLCEDYNGGDDDDGGGELDNNLIIQDTYKINSVYPNPFNPTTTIMYQIPEFSNISIDVYNMNGQMIQNLHSGFKNPGEYSIIWNASNVTSGIYLIKLVSGSFIETQKVILIK